MGQTSDLDTDLRRLTPTVHAAFRLTSERHTLDHLLTEFELPGAIAWRKGESIGASDTQRRTHGWRFELPAQRTYVLDDTLTRLLQALAAHREAIVAATRALELDAHVTLHATMYAHHVPAAYLSAANVRAVAAYGASLDTGIRLSSLID